MTLFKTLTKSALTVCVLGAAGWGIRYATAPAYTGTAGITYGSFDAPTRGEEVDFHLWYPATPGGRAVTVGGNGVFYGTPAGHGAPHAAGAAPLIVMSHGGGGNAGQLGWIAAKLAQAGYAVALPNHPGNTSGNASGAEMVKVWKRPPDVSDLIDALAAGDYPFLDLSRIAAMGFSSGGYTAMALSGARVDSDRLQGFCDDDQTGMSDCAILAHWGIDLHSIDLSPAAQDHRDPRIAAGVIIDPGIVSTLTDESLREIDIPMQIINLGTEGDVPNGVDAGRAAGLIADIDYSFVDDAWHFTFLAQCKARGAAILASEGEPDALCDEPGARDRGAKQDEIAARVIAFLDARL